MRLASGLSVDGIRAMREQVERYALDIDAKADELCRRLAEIGVDAAVAGVKHDETGELRSSIRWEQRGEREYLVVADCGYAVYVEFGTGAVGAGGEYPGERPEGIREPDGGKEGWVYYDERQGRFRITDGQKRSMGFMANSAMTMQQEIAAVAKEVFAS